jgi:hypothetical membrane protein
MFQWSAVAIPEIIAALAAFVWSIVLGIKLSKQASRSQLQSK